MAISLWNLAVLYYNLERMVEAKPLITRAVAIFERTLGDQHPRTLNAAWVVAGDSREWGVGCRV